MTWAALLAVLSATPASVSVDEGSACAPRAVLARELARTSLALVEADGDLRVTLTPRETGFALVVRRGSMVGLERTLKDGTCDDAGLATALILERYVQEVASPPLPAGTPDAGVKSSAEVVVAKKPTKKAPKATKPGKATSAAQWEDPYRAPGASLGVGADVSASATGASGSAGPSSGVGSGTAAAGTTRAGTGTGVATPGTSAAVGAAAVAAGTGASASSATSRTSSGAGAASAGTAVAASGTSAAVAPGAGAAGSGASTSAASSGTGAGTSAAVAPGAGAAGSGASTSATSSGAGAGTSAAGGTGADAAATGASVSSATSETNAGAGSATATTAVADPGEKSGPRANSGTNSGAAAATAGAALTTSGTSATTASTSDAAARRDVRVEKAEVSHGEVISSAPASPPVRITRWEVLAGAGSWLPSPSTVSLALSLDAALVLQEHWRVALGGAFSFGGSVPVTDETGASRGTLTARALLLAPSAAWCTASRVRVCGGLLAGVRLGVGSTSGDYIYQAATRWTATPTFGPLGQLATSFSRVTAALDLSLLVNPVPSSFTLQGLDAHIDTPVVEFLARLSIGYGVDR